MWVCELGFWLLLLGVTYLFVVYFVSFVGQDGASTISSCHGMLLCLVAERRELHVEGGGGEGGSVREGGAGRYVGRGRERESVMEREQGRTSETLKDIVSFSRDYRT